MYGYHILHGISKGTFEIPHKIACPYWRYYFQIEELISVFKTNPTYIYIYIYIYRQVSNISRTLVGNKIVDNSDVVGASPVGAAPATSSLST